MRQDVLSEPGGAGGSHQSLQRVQLCALNVRVQLLDDEGQQKLQKNKLKLKQQHRGRGGDAGPTSANFGVPARTPLSVVTSSSLVMPWGSLGG